MRSRRHGRGATPGERGAALVITMWVTLILALAVVGFAYTMHVETRIASLYRKQFKAKQLAMGGIELGKYLLAWDMDQANPKADRAVDYLGEAWALGTNVVLQTGVIEVHIADEGGKLDINLISDQTGQNVSPELLRSYFDGGGAYDEEFDPDTFIDSTLDWIDGNDSYRMNGAETEYYESLGPPYQAKDGPIDNLEELLLVKGMTWRIFLGRDPLEPPGPGLAGMVDHWTALGGIRARLNINTAPPEVLGILPGSDSSTAEQILSRRAGPDTIEGTEDDMPFRSTGEIAPILNLPGSDARSLGRLFTTRSSVFTITAIGRVGNVEQRVHATVLRSGQVLRILRWREGRL